MPVKNFAKAVFKCTNVKSACVMESDGFVVSLGNRSAFFRVHPDLLLRKGCEGLSFISFMLR
jgi:hypothetical protein